MFLLIGIFPHQSSAYTRLPEPARAFAGPLVRNVFALPATAADVAFEIGGDPGAQIRHRDVPAGQQLHIGARPEKGPLPVYALLDSRAIVM
jgi:hypothetical protein